MLRDKVEAFIRELVGAAQTFSLYGPAHRLTKDAIGKLYTRLNETFLEREEITVGIIGDEIAFEKEPFYKVSRYIENFIAYLKEKKIEKASFLKGATQGELEAFLGIITMNVKLIETSGGLSSIADSKGLRHISFGRIGLGKTDRAASQGDYASASSVFQEGIKFLDKTTSDIDNNLPIDVKTAAFFINGVINNVPENRDSFLILTAVKHHDVYTFLHLINVAILTIAQAEALGLKGDSLSNMGLAGLLHDTGKLRLSGDILRKKGKLTAEDVDRLRVHPIDGAKILVGLDGLSPVVAIASFEHHIRYDMTGYPQKLYGASANLASMLVAISDMYDAMRGKRPYHEGAMPETVYEEMNKLSGTQFHPDLLDNFFRVISVYPPGTLVELEDGAVGIVIKSNPSEIKKPVVEVLYNKRGIKEDKPYLVERASIEKSIAPSDRYEIPSRYQ